MKWIKFILTATTLMVAASSIPASAHGHSYRGPRVSFGIGINLTPFPSYYGPSYYSPYYSGSYYGRPYAPYPYRYYPEVVTNTVISPAPNIIYIQSADNPQPYQYPAQSQQQLPLQPATVNPETGGNDWYYCNNPDGFYPAIRNCPSGWQRISK